MRTLIIGCTSLLLLTGCIKSKELRNAEANLEKHAKSAEQKYKPECSMRAYELFPPNIQQAVIPGRAAIKTDCSNAKTALCGWGDRAGTPDRYRNYDASTAARNDYITNCVVSKAQADELFMEKGRKLKAKIDAIKANED